MAKKFGNTWWSRQWLNALKNVTDENRLPRGATYARQGHVLSIRLKTHGEVEANVAGSRPTPYQVRLKIPTFSTQQIDALCQAISNTPSVLAKLLNNELDPAVLQIAEELNIPLFPKTAFTELKSANKNKRSRLEQDGVNQSWQMSCSCPDAALPCKHQAAVLYCLGEELDQDPMQLFHLHYLNLPQELKNRGTEFDNDEHLLIPFILNVLDVSETPEQAVFPEHIYRGLDFSRLQNHSQALLTLLEPDPPFYPFGFYRQVYTMHLRNAMKQAKSILEKPERFSKMLQKKRIRDAQTTINHHSHWHIVMNFDQNGVWRFSVDGKDAQGMIMPRLLEQLLLLNPADLRNHTHHTAALHQACLCALHLLKNGMVIPQLVNIGLDSPLISVLWKPALQDEQVRILLDDLSQRVPADVLMWCAPTSKGVAKKQINVHVKNRGTALVSIFANMLMFFCYEERGIEQYDNALLFGLQPFPPNERKDHHHFRAMQRWLSPYYLADLSSKPVLLISEETDEKFGIHLGITDPKNPQAEPISLQQVFALKKYESQRFSILATLSLLEHFVPHLSNYINQRAAKPIVLNNQEFTQFFVEILPAIRLLNIPVILPKSLQHLVRPQVSMKIKSSKKSISFLSLNDILSFDWQVALGDELVSPQEFKALAKQAGKLVKFKGQYIYVDAADLEKFTQTFKEKPSAAELLQTALSGSYHGAAISLSEEVSAIIRELTETDSIRLPENLQTTLRPYQERGYAWLYRNAKIGFGSIIADDMGLGKTVQVIAFLLKQQEEGLLDNTKPALVAVPTGLLSNWQTELAKFAPSLNVAVYHSSKRDLNNINADVVLTTYGTVRSDVEKLQEREWQIIIIDEAQNIKNHGTSQSKAIKNISAPLRIAMSGTPVENHLSEFWSIMDFANHGYLSNLTAFSRDYATPIIQENNRQAAERFKKVTAPFLLRRMKTDKSIISDLPDKIEKNELVQLVKKQTALYQKTVEEGMKAITAIDTNGADHQTLFKRQGLVLQMMLALKQICNHPVQFLKAGKADVASSGKTELLLTLLDSIVQSDEKVLVFTQFKEMGNLLVQMIGNQFGEIPMFLHGGCSVKKRQEMVDCFQNSRADKIFILSLKAAGTGLNLTAASHVIHYDLWWNPAVENQATDRAYRIGQKNNVMVHRLICKDTFEEKIDAMIRYKQELAELTVGSGEHWVGQLSNQELRDLFQAA
ncbi:SNF2-related protein [Stenoxybacter acetivorans]|uniref:SNF2-related protein n=1 Tax=Stenoxybacter acetivorans TaxID=422441 RepID=UPI000560EF01|nr:SNF2-related protein [Stenoxybacter acetivorans]